MSWVLPNIDDQKYRGPETLKFRFNLKMPPLIYGNACGGTGRSCPRNTGKRWRCGFADKPIGSGPFKWVDYKQDQYFTMEAVPKHHRKSPEFKTLKIVFVDDLDPNGHAEGREADHRPGRTAYPQVKADPNLKLIQIEHIIARPAIAISPFRKKKAPFWISGSVKRPAWPSIAKESATKSFSADPSPRRGNVSLQYGLGPERSNPILMIRRRSKELLAKAGYPTGFQTTFNATAGAKESGWRPSPPIWPMSVSKPT